MVVKKMTKIKVAMIVLNAISHDIRVLKEAQSLKNENYDVSIIGVADNRSQLYERVDKVSIFRVVAKPSKKSIFMKILNGCAKPWKLLGMLAFSFSFYLLIACFYARHFDPGNISASFNALSKGILDNYGWLFLFVNLSLLFGDMIFKTGVKVLKYTQKRASFEIISISKLYDELNRIKNINYHMQATLAQLNPAIVHCHDLNSLVIGAAYKRKKKGNCILVYDSHEIFELTTGSTFFRRLVFTYIQKKLSKQVDGFITINRSIAEFLRQKYSSLPEVNIIKNASIFKTIEKKENLFYQHLNIPENKKIILFQGGFGVGRGLVKLVQAAKFFNDEWVVVFMGWGKLHATLQQLASRNGLLNSRVFFGDKVSQEDLPYWTSSATIGIIPYENTCLNHLYCTPNKLWEYTLAGVPILASPFPEMKKIINQGVGWLLEDPINEHNIAHVVRNIAQNDIDDAKKKCIEFIKQDNWSKYETRLLTLYGSLKPMKQVA
jgi:glycosyltransferase involved in cell wall biosynthesis